jgi:hypothetical protein
MWSVAGPIVWFLHLSVLYAAETLTCLAPGPEAGAMFAVSAVATAVALAILAGMAVFQFRRRRIAAERFLADVGLLLSALALAGVLFAFLAVAMVRACSDFAL